MGNLLDKRGTEMNKGEHFVYYVSDMETPPLTGHFRKMDAGREIARHICKSLRHGKLMKYTEYDGAVISAQSVGIVFPTHMWGSSLAVYSFLRHLRVGRNTYIYAVAVGEALSGAVEETIPRRINSLEEFRRIFIRRGFGTESDIFVRCIDRNRENDMPQDAAAGEQTDREHLQTVMDGLLFHSMERLTDHAGVASRVVHDEKAVSESGQSGNCQKKLGNVFLDENMLSGVRLCRVM